MKEKVITDNTTEKITVKWDEGRFAIMSQKEVDKGYKLDPTVGYSCIILNPQEMMELIKFGTTLGKEE